MSRSVVGRLVVAWSLVAVGLHGVNAQQAAPALLADRDGIARLVRAWNERLPFVPGEVLVKFRDGTTTREQARALSQLRADAGQRQDTWIGNALLVRSAVDLDSDVVADQLARQPEVEWAQPNYQRHTQATPNDPSYPRQWNFEAIKMPLAWDINPGATSAVTVAVIDSGVTAAGGPQIFPLWTGSRVEAVSVPFAVNPDLPASRMTGARDYAFWNGPVLDMVGHGTHVAATVLEETNNGLSLAGIAHRARLMPIKACYGYWEVQIVRSNAGIPGYVDPREEGDCPDAAVAQAIRYAADSGAQIINISLGGRFTAPAHLEALQYAVQRGAFVAISAGNAFEDGNPVLYPAAYAATLDGVVSVGAVGRSLRRAYYSSTGSHLEIVAPGGDVRDGGLTGTVYQSAPLGADSDPFTVTRPRFDRYTEVPNQGTSMASPHVAGVAALLYSQGITRPAAIEAALKRFAVDLGAPGRDNDYGFGLIDARASLRGLGVAR